MDELKIKKREYDQKWRLKNIHRIKDINKKWREEEFINIIKSIYVKFRE